jgi:hypothetical protein
MIMTHSLYQLRWRLLESFLLLLLAISLGAGNGRIRVMGETLWYQYTTRQLTVKTIKNPSIRTRSNAIAPITAVK